jgi:GTPase
MNRNLLRTRRIAIPSVIFVKQTDNIASDVQTTIETDVQALLRRIEILENSIAQLRAQIQNPSPPWWVDPEVG